VTDILPHVLFRFIHVSSVILFLGGIVYARQVLTPVLEALPEALRIETAAGTQLRYRNTLYVLLGLIVASGLYNFLTGPHHGQPYQIWFGVKMLLVAHILATAILWAASANSNAKIAGKSKRRLVSMAISGFIIVFISAYLRSLTLRGL
jgi:uncharacterized membrane protein